MTNDFDKALGQVLRRLRKQRGLSQSAVGAVIGCTYQQIQKNEAGKNRVYASSLPKYAAFFGVTVASIYEEAGHIDSSTGIPEIEEESLAVARYVSRISDPRVRMLVVGLARRAAHSMEKAA